MKQVLATLMVLAGFSACSIPQVPERQAWTTSRVTGSPEPPPPFRTERVFPKLTLKLPVDLTYAPGCDRLFVVTQKGLVYSIPNAPDVDRADLFIDLHEVAGL
ncbi:MAG TPA: hypothetical protein VMU54_14960, partial [Planctomycetota bacterium]|nr:hypothetical protein [Planctomycetota bacterium]